MNKCSESIFRGKTAIIPMADVSHIEKQIAREDSINPNNSFKRGDVTGYFVITKHTTWNQEIDFWNNNIWLDIEEGKSFLMAWCFYRHETEGGAKAFKSPEELLDNQ